MGTLKANAAMTSHYDMLMKLVIVGDSGTGKSCVISRYCDDEFTHLGMSTIGVDFRIQLLEHNSKILKLQLWDTAGQERFRSLTGNYYKSADSIILTYDATDEQTVKSLEDTWLPEVRRLSASSLEEEGNILVLGTKMDLEHDPATVARAEAWAQSLGFGHALCSSLTGENCDTAIEDFVHQVADTATFHTHVRRRSAAAAHETLNPPMQTPVGGRFSSLGGCFEKMFEQIRCFQSAAVHYQSAAVH